MTDPLSAGRLQSLKAVVPVYYSQLFMVTYRGGVRCVFGKFFLSSITIFLMEIIRKQYL